MSRFTYSNFPSNNIQNMSLFMPTIDKFYHLPCYIIYYVGGYPDLNRGHTVPHTVVLPAELYLPLLLYFYPEMIRTFNVKYQKFMTYLLVYEILLYIYIYIIIGDKSRTCTVLQPFHPKWNLSTSFSTPIFTFYKR